MRCVGDNPANMNRTGGFTLVETMITLSILGIIVMALGFTFQGWMARHKVASQTRELFADIIEARAKAMQKGRATFVDIVGNTITTYEDTNTSPDGNLTLETASDRRIATRTPNYPVVANLTDGATRIRFSREGIADVSGVIHLHSTFNPDVDCISIGKTRVKPGRYNDATNVCIEQ
jgi:prepilin-type N-terminal cleavage/methylation domain-containing protein